MINAHRRRWFVCLAALVAIISVLGSSGWAQVTIEIKPTLGPNLLSSPQTTAYTENVLTMLRDGQEQVSSSDAPAATVNVRTRFTAGEVICASFPLWRGQACPGGDLDKEFGNRVQFATRIAGNGQKFRLSDLSYKVTATNPALGEVMSGRLDKVKYDFNRIGINYGPDGARGTEDDVVYSSGEDTTQLVDEVLYVGAGIGWQPDKEDWPGVGPTRPEKTPEVLQPIVDKSAIDLTEHRDFELTAVYTLASPDDAAVTLASASSSVTVVGFPEPEAPLVPEIAPRTLAITSVAILGLIVLVIAAGVLKEKFFPSKGV